MKIDLKILSSVSFFICLAAGVLYFTRWGDTEAPVERAASIAVSDHVTLDVVSNALKLELKGCDVAQVPDNFFLHIYPRDTSKAGAEGFINKDFNLNSLKPTSTETRSGIAYCRYEVAYGLSTVDRVAVGQFRSPQGNCCEILWDKQVSFNK
ncbi:MULTISPECIES: hypothetical protein [Pseudomonas]|uniref:Uncharacterized protein n=1 Tax=Pseudomonas fluorescens TaxID=294 RepID=A0A7Z3H1R5_PSEFL|nr:MULTISPECIES: hypothetical protein [Pseudomonas]QJP96824.1 hypothetical protein C6Y56_20440 [Pseudomonas fluorescens]